MAMTGNSHIHPYHSFGVCKGVRNNLLLPDERTVIFPSGKHCIRYHIPEQRSEFIHGTKGNKGLQSLTLSLDQRYLAVSERGQWGTITIYELKTETCPMKQVLKGQDLGVHEFVSLAFSADSKYLLGQSGGPKWSLFYWQWIENEVIATAQTSNSAVVSQVSFNPYDEKQICVSGKGLLKLFELQKGSLRQGKSFRVEKENILCHTWLSRDCFISGTETGKLLMVKSSRLHNLGMPFDSKTDKKGFSAPGLLPSVTAITSFSKGFACSAGVGLVCLYENSDGKDGYKKSAEIRIPEDTYTNQPLQAIAMMCISPEEETLAVSTDRGQLYKISLSSPEISLNKKDYFEFLCHPLHSGSITGMSVCSSKPLIATCSKDGTVHIWNYNSMFLEQFKEFDEEPLCVSIHPGGHSILVGFSTDVCLMNLLNDSMRIVQKFNIHNCAECVFNHDGNLFAATSNKLIYIYNIRTQNSLELVGHPKKVQSVRWSDDDQHLVSCGLDGTVYLWNTLTGTYESKNETECSYADVMFSPINKSILAVDRSNLKEIQDGRIQTELTSEGLSYTAIARTHLGERIFVGTSTGSIRVFEYPLDQKKPWAVYQAHSRPITKMVVTPSDQFLLTASEDNCLLVWVIADQDGRTLEMVQDMDYTEEILCAKSYLEDKEDSISELKAHVEWQRSELEYRLNMKDVDFKKNLKIVMQNYVQQIEALQDQMKVLNTEKEDQKVFYQDTIATMIEKYTKDLKDEELSYSKAMVAEHDKYVDLEKKMQMMQQKHEKKLQEREANYLHSMEGMKQSYEAKLKELQDKWEEEVKNFQVYKEAAEFEIKDIYRSYNLDLQMEAETQEKLQLDMKFMEKKIAQHEALKSRIEDQGCKINNLQQETEDLKKQLRDAKKNINDLTKEKEDQRNTISDQIRYIEELQKSIKIRDKSLEEKQAELSQLITEGKLQEEQNKLRSEKERSEVDQLQRTLQEYKEDLRMVENKLREIKAESEEVIADLKEKVKSRDQALLRERHKVRDVNIKVHRMTSDIHNCARFVQDLKKLKKSFIELHERYMHQEEVTMEIDAQVMQEHTRNTERLQNIIASQNASRIKELKHGEEAYAKAVRESGFLVQSLNYQRAVNMKLQNCLKGKSASRSAGSALLSEEVLEDLTDPQHMVPFPGTEKQLLQKRLQDKRPH
ncbi:cilia- and flagella-associated protein 57-like isoform 1-T1 [Clarias gariepinus]